MNSSTPCLLDIITDNGKKHTKEKKTKKTHIFKTKERTVTETLKDLNTSYEYMSYHHPQTYDKVNGFLQLYIKYLQRS